MGTDIYMFVEVRADDGVWHQITDRRFPGLGDYAPRLRSLLSDDEEWGELLTRGNDMPYWGRNYTLFAILADVRNEDDVEPIAQPRGVPDDATLEWLEYVEDGESLHSHSWLTLRELEAYDWQHVPTRDGSMLLPERVPLGGFGYTIGQLRELGGPDDVRIVFALFD